MIKITTLEILNDPPNNRKLKMETAIPVYAGELFEYVCDANSKDIMVLISDAMLGI